LAAESVGGNLPHIDLQNVHLSKYVSFRDEVRVDDLARAFEAAFKGEVAPNLSNGERFICITHSTGGPVIRQWWQRYREAGTPSPMSHLIMLAPANFGSALAQLGKGRLSRLRSWWNSIEPGQGVLDWLEHASPESWELNRQWIEKSPQIDPSTTNPPTYLFVLTGQTIDRQLYDHVNTYTGEAGSDGTVRVAAANLNSTYVRLEQTDQGNAVVSPFVDALERNDPGFDLDGYAFGTNLMVARQAVSAKVAFKIVPGVSHTGKSNGILFSISESGRHETVDAVLRCAKVNSSRAYRALCKAFADENIVVHDNERLEPGKGLLRGKNYFCDAHSLIMVRIVDDRGQPITDFDFKLTGKQDKPDGLPEGFFVDRQRNLRDRSAFTLYVNYDAMHDRKPVKDSRGRVVRAGLPGVDRLGIRVYAYPMNGFAHYLPGVLAAAPGEVENYVRPDQTTLFEIVLRRIVHQGAYLLVPASDPALGGDFRDQAKGPVI
jgi:hypothetical protein